MKKVLLIIMIYLSLINPAFSQKLITNDPSQHDLNFVQLPKSWDEGIPLGNGMVGSLIWQNNGKLRLSLDRADLWDLRPMPNLSRKEYKFSWVIDQVKKDDYKIVQDLFDKPYEDLPAPTKIPAGALEFDISRLGDIEYVHLYTKNATCEIKWKNGTKFISFVHAFKPLGWFRFENINSELTPVLIAPQYTSADSSGKSNSVIGQDLSRLGYKQGKVNASKNKIYYLQYGWNGFYYTISVNWKNGRDYIEGLWSISSHMPRKPKSEESNVTVQNAMALGINKNYSEHEKWWQGFWAKSSISIPDKILEKQWYMEMYKFGAASRRGAPPISLQAIWTADNGKLPPWKGDFHNDLNTQLSYWPCYSSNHLEEGLAYLDWMWNIKDVAKKYTRDYFGTNGLNIPGVSTLTGEPMGGWIQYSFSPTTSIWLSQPFYLHWRYSMDKTFLKQRTYPWIKDVIAYINELTIKDQNNRRRLPLSSSPEIDDNSIKAWHLETTNFDLALIRWLYKTASELADELNLKEDSKQYKNILNEWPDLAVSSSNGALCVAPGQNLLESHRHFSHLMAIFPLGIINWDNGKIDQEIMNNSLNELEKLGTDYWCGYSYSWLGNLKARAMDGDGAANTLKTFAQCFCLPNSFHANGDQSGTGKSKFTYRPFTLEGNFAFASGIQEMLVQSYSGIIKIFPAIPLDWKDVSFENLRAEGAFLISANKKAGEMKELKIVSEKGGIIKIYNPFGINNLTVKGSKKYTIDKIITIETRPKDLIIISCQ